MKAFVVGCLFAVTLILSGCYTPPPPPPPAVAVQAPPPPVAAPVPPPTGYASYAPDYYVWDGNEYVGVIGDQYVYYSGGVWVTAPSVIVGRFHGWERYHPDWRRHAYRRGRRPYYR